MASCLVTGVSSLLGAVVLGAVFGEPAIAALMVVFGLFCLIVGVRLLKKYGTGLNE